MEQFIKRSGGWSSLSVVTLLINIENLRTETIVYKQSLLY